MIRRGSIRTRLFLLLLGFSFAPILVISLIFFLSAVRGTQANVRRLTHSQVQSWAETFSTRKREIERMLQTLGRILPARLRENPDSLVAFLTQTLLRGRGFGQILYGKIRERYPRLVFRIQGHEPGGTVRWIYHTQEELRENWAYLWALPLRDYYRYRQSAPEYPLQTIGLRYTIYGPVLRYMVYLGMGDVLLADVRLAALVPPAAVVVSENGFVLRHPDPRYEQLPLREALGVRLANTGDTTFFLIGKRVGGTLRKVENFYLMSYQVLEPFFRPLLRFLWGATALAAFLGLLAFLIAYGISGVLSRDVEVLSRAVERVARGDFRVEIEPVRTGDELQTLAESIAEMVQKLRDFYEKILYYEPLAQVGELSAGIAHEVRNPLQAIRSCAEAIHRLSDHPRILALTAQIQAEVQRLSDLVEGILLFARPTVPRPRSIPLRDFLRGLRNLWLQEASSRKKDLAFHLEVPDGLRVYADPNHLTQILWNLVRNAIDASPEGGRITLRARRENGRVSLEVEDQGPGVPEDQRILIFHPFFSSKKSGAGLGLSISKRLAQLNGGEIWVEDAPRQGARFVLQLPEKEESDDSRASGG